jgi:colicin import membrane protein
MLIIGAVLSCAVAGFACQKTPVEAHNDGVEAQREADDKVLEANKQAGEKIAEANRDVAAATDAAKKTSAEAQAKANEKIRDNNRIVVGHGSDSHRWGQKEIDSVDGMIDEATTKVQTATPQAKAQFNAAIAGVKQQRDALRAELATLETPAGAKLDDKSKSQFAERVDRVKLDIKNMQKSN